MPKKKTIIGTLKDINNGARVLTGHDLGFYARMGWDLKGKRMFEDFLRGGPKPAPEPEDSPYKVLGIKRGCSDKIVELAWKLKSWETHPDHGGDIEEFKKVSAAHDKITDARKKIKKERGL